MNIDWYHSFLSVAKHLSYRKASEELYVGKTTIFQQIKHLEEHLQVSLFKSEKKKLRLTNTGEMLIPIAQNFVKIYEQGIEKLQKEESGFSTSLRIGVSPYVANYIISKFLPTLFKKAPCLSISVQMIDKKDIVSKLENRELDVVISRVKPFSLKVKTDKIYEGNMKLLVPDVDENANFENEEYYLEKYCIFCDNHPEHWKKLRKKIRNEVPKANFRVIENVLISENLIKANMGVSYLPIHILRDRSDSGVKVIETNLFPELNSFVYISILEGNLQISQFKLIFADFVKECSEFVL
ncbi:LysR family transcriptional regulator [Bacillus thuringiensis]